MKKIFTLIAFAVLTALFSSEIKAQVRPPILKEDFENAPSSTNSLPEGWSQNIVTGNEKWAFSREGTEKSICMEYNCWASAATGQLLTPTFKVPGDGYVLSFDYMMKVDKRYADDPLNVFYVYISLDGGNTFAKEPLLEMHGDVREWTHRMVAIPASASDDVVIAFHAQKGSFMGSYSEFIILVDNVTVDAAPRCAAPADLRISSIGSDFAILSWNYSDFGETSSFVEISLMQNGHEIRRDIVETEQFGSIEVGNLNTKETYSVRLRTDCSESYLGKSQWSKSIEFSTICEKTTLPVEYTFDDLTVAPPCWTVDNAQINLSGDTAYRNQSLRVVPDADVQTVYLYTEPVDHEANDLEISFWAYNAASVAKDVSLGLQTDIMASGTYAEINTVTLPSRQWKKVTLYSDDNAHEQIKNASVVFIAKECDNDYRLYIDNLKIQAIPACRQPLSVNITSISATAATFVWDATAGEKLMVYKASETDTTLLGTLDGSGNALSGLTADTDYSFVYKYSCGNGSKSDFGPVAHSIHTSCEAVSEIHADFETGNLPSCWRDKGANNNSSWKTTNNYSYKSTYSVTLGMTSGESGVPLTLPLINIPEENTHILRLYMYRSQYSFEKADRINIYTSTLPDTIGATLLGTVHGSITQEPVVPSSGWYEYQFTLPVKGEQYIIISGITESGGRALFLDNIDVMKKPTCPHPEELSINTNEIGTSSVKVTWNQPDNTSTEWELTYSHSSLGENPFVVPVSGKPEYTITGLTANTEYQRFQVSVKAVCGAGDESETLTETFNFSTQCNSIDITTSNWIDDFTDNSWNCWDVVQGTTTTQTNGVHFTSTYVTAVLPEVVYNNLDNYKIYFLCQQDSWYSSAFTRKSTVEAGIITDLSDSESFVSLGTISIPNANVTRYGISLAGYTGAPGRIALRFTKGADGGLKDLILKEVALRNSAICPSVNKVVLENAFGNTAKFSVLCDGIATNLEAEYGPKGFEHGTGTTLTGIESEFTVSGLEAGKDYDIYVKAICTDDVAWWSDVCSFNSGCSPAEISEATEFYDDFETTKNCWTTAPVDGYRNWTIAPQPMYAQSGTFYADLTSGINGENEADIHSDLYRAVTLEAGKRYEFSCYVRNIGQGNRFSVAYGNSMTPDDAGAVEILTIAFEQDEKDSYYKRVSGTFTAEKDAAVLRLRGKAVPQTGINRGSIYVDNLKIVASACDYPENVIINAISDIAAEIAWSPVSGISGYNVKIFSEEGKNPLTDTGDIKDETNLTTTSLEITSLEPNKDYFFHVQSICNDGGNSAWTEALTIHTLCSDKSIPFEETFADNSALDCWMFENGSASVKTNGDETYCETATGKATNLISPTFDISSPISGYEMSLRVFVPSDTVTLSFGTVPNPGNLADICPVSEVKLPKTKQWEEIVVHFNGLTDDEVCNMAKNIIITTSGRCYIDDFKMTTLPSCPQPTGLTVNNITSDGAELQWNLYSDTECHVTVKRDGVIVTEYDKVNSPLRLNNLDAIVTYTVEVHALCADAQTSTPAIAEFTTACGVTTVPFFENFNSYTTNEFPKCWADSIKNVVEDRNKWHIEDAGYVRNVTLNDPCITFDAYFNPRNNSCLLQTPVIDLTGTDKPELSFLSAAPGAAIMHVAVSVDGGKTFNDTIGKDLSSNSYQLKEYSFDLSKYKDQQIAIGFIGISNYGTSYIFIDDVFVGNIACKKPKNLTVGELSSFSAKCTIDDPDHSDWQMAVGEKGFNPDTMTTLIDMTTTEKLVEGLNPSTEYEVYLRTDCKADGYSEWFGPVRFTTLCASEAIPYTQNFESLKNVANLKCYNIISEYGSALKANDDYGLSQDANMVSEGNQALLMSNYSNAFVVLPEMDEDIEKLLLSFSAYVAGADKTKAEIGLIHEDDLLHPSNKFIPASIKEYVFEAGQKSEIKCHLSLCNKTGRGYRIAIKIPGKWGVNFVIDDIRVDHVPSFDIPFITDITDITATSATLAWNNSEEAVSTQIQLNDEEPIFVNETETATGSYPLSGLTPSTNYTVKVRSIRGEEAGDTTEWSFTRKFTTYQIPATMPYSCNFEADDTDITKWSMVSDAEDMKWVVSGDDPTAIYQGSGALYVVGETGKHTYVGRKEKGIANVLAYRTFTLEKGVKYDLSFVYHSEGLNDYWSPDCMNVYLVPFDQNTSSNQSTRINVLQQKYNVKDWTSFAGEVVVPNDGKYDLVFSWYAGTSYSALPSKQFIPGAIDSLVFAEKMCLPLTNVKVDSLSTTRADIIWNNENRYENKVEYVLLSGDETFDETTATIKEATADTLRLTELTADTEYRVYIRTICGECSMPWIGPIGFATPCISTEVSYGNEFTDGFEEYSATDLGCWKQVGNKMWNCEEQSSVNPNAYNGNKRITVASGETAKIMRLFTLKSGVNYQLSFYAATEKAGNGTNVNVYVGGEFDNVANLTKKYQTAVNNTEYTKFAARFNVDKDGIYKVAVEGQAGYYNGRLALDELSLYTVECDMPTELDITDITANTATVKWSGTAEKYQLEITSSASSETIEVQNATEYSLTSLLGSSRYIVKVSSICPNGHLSETATTAFTTEGGATTIAPYYEDFDMTETIPLYWSNSGNAQNKWSIHKDELTGNTAMQFESSYNEAGSTDTLTAISVLIPAEGYTMSMDYINPAGGPLSICMMIDETEEVTLLNKATAIGSWQTLSESLDRYVGKTVTVKAIGISNYSPSNGAYMQIDNLRIGLTNETVTYNDTLCYGEPYMEHGFEIPADAINYGINNFTRVTYGTLPGSPASIYDINVFVPQSDVYIEDLITADVPYNENGFKGITEAGEYERTIPSSLGCDSTIHLSLLADKIFVEHYDTICEGGSMMICGKEVSETDTYHCSVKGEKGQDTMFTYHLTVLPKLVEREMTICQGDAVMFDGIERTDSDVYEADSTYNNGCTYTSRLILNVIDSVIKLDTAICQGRYVEVNGIRYNKTGKYRIALEQVSGCNRIMKLDLTVTSADTATYNTTSCDGKPLDYLGFEAASITADTVLLRIDHTDAGCDSVTKLVVTLLPNIEVFDTVTTTEKVYEYDGRTLTSGGDYVAKGIADNGCDSINHLHLEMQTGIHTPEIRNLVIAPNPTSEGITAYAYGEFDDKRGLHLEIFDETGRKVCDRIVYENPVPLNDITAAGLYLVRITTNDGSVHSGRLVVR